MVMPALIRPSQSVSSFQRQFLSGLHFQYRRNIRMPAIVSGVRLVLERFGPIYFNPLHKRTTFPMTVEVSLNQVKPLSEFPGFVVKSHSMDIPWNGR